MDSITSTPMPKVIAVRREGAVTIILGTKHFVKTGDNADDIYKAAMAYSITNTPTDLDNLENLIFPHKKHLRNGDFVEGPNGEIFFSGTDIPIPAKLTDELFEFLDNGWPIDALKKFWFRAMLNPSQHGRDGFFRFCKEYGVTITSNGYALLYKAVTTKTLIPKELDLASLVGEAYLSIIRSGEDPANSLVIELSAIDEEISYMIAEAGMDIDGTVVGTVADVFADIPELAKNKPTTVYTDKYTRTMDIKLGIPVVKERSECDPDINASCSYGLHVGSYSYVSMFGGRSDVVFACLVDPANVVALPTHDNSKIRVCDYLPYAIMDREDDGAWEEIDSGFFESDYEVHDALTLEARFKELTDKLAEDSSGYTPDDIVSMSNELTVVTTRMQTLSHVDTRDAVDVVQAPNDPTEFDQDNPDSPQNTASSYTEQDDSWDGDDAAFEEVTEERESFEEWVTLRGSGQTDMNYHDWLGRSQF